MSTRPDVWLLHTCQVQESLQDQEDETASAIQGTQRSKRELQAAKEEASSLRQQMQQLEDDANLGNKAAQTAKRELGRVKEELEETEATNATLRSELVEV